MSAATASGNPSSRRRGGARELLDEPPRDRRLEQRVAGRRDADRVEQPGGGRVLEQEAARADAQRVVDVLARAERREHEHRGAEPRVAEDRLGRAQPVELRHPDVHEHDVGSQARARCRSAMRPSPASPTTVMSGSASTITRKPARTSAWSSAIPTVIGAGAAGVGRRRLGDEHLRDPDRLADAAQAQRTGRADGGGRVTAGDQAHGLRHEDLPGLRCLAQTRGDERRVEDSSPASSPTRSAPARASAMAQSTRGGRPGERRCEPVDVARRLLAGCSRRSSAASRRERAPRAGRRRMPWPAASSPPGRARHLREGCGITRAGDDGGARAIEAARRTRLEEVLRCFAP